MNPSRYLTDVFGQEGFLAQGNPAYEPRLHSSQWRCHRYEEQTQQVRLAEEIDRAFSEARHLLAEGPCGVGKSFAYLVPAVHHAVQNRKKIVIATANIALQEQLVAMDLPFLQRILPWPFRFALLKGLGNYLCLGKRSDIEVKREGMFGLDAEVERLWSWSQETATGDASELSFQPSSQAWAQFSVDGVAEIEWGGRHAQHVEKGCARHEGKSFLPGTKIFAAGTLRQGIIGWRENSRATWRLPPRRGESRPGDEHHREQNHEQTNARWGVNRDGFRGRGGRQGRAYTYRWSIGGLCCRGIRGLWRGGIRGL